MHDAPTVIFLGPSLGLERARELLPGRYLPPARRGDVYRVIPTGVRRILLVDGVFHLAPSVLHTELLAAMSEGIEVVGAASMGALRAAELDRHGMRGLGTIYAWYKSGVIRDDDEVALLHADHENAFRPLSEPLVNVRHALARATESGLLSPEEARAMFIEARDRHFGDRSFVALLSGRTAKTLDANRRRELGRTLRESESLKSRDAAFALRWCASHPVAAPLGAPALALRDLERAALLDAGFMSAPHDVAVSTMLERAREHHPERLVALEREAVDRAFLLDWARERGAHPPDEEVATFVAAWKARYVEGDWANWLARNGLTESRFGALMLERATVAWLRREGPEHFGLAFDAAIEVATALQLSAEAERHLIHLARARHDESAS